MRSVIARTMLSIATAAAALHPAPAAAIPVFARIYNKPCGTCHTVFPQLNPQGEDFRAHGFHGLPTAVEPMRVGPHLQLPGTLPLALYLTAGEDLSQTHAHGEPSPLREHLDLDYLSILAGGELGPHLAFLVDYEILETEPDVGSLTVNTLPEQAYLQAHLDTMGWLGNARLGWFELPLGVSPRVHRLSAEPYLTYGLTGCALLDRAPPGVRCDDVPIPGEAQIGAELSALRPSTGFAWAAGVTNGSNNQLHDEASRDLYLHLSQAIGLHRLGFFLLYSPDVYRNGPSNRTLRLGPDLNWYTRRLRVLAQFLANYESNPTGHAQSLWYYAGFVEGECRLTARLLGLLRAEYAWTSRFDDTRAGGDARARRRLWAVTGGGQWLLLENVKLVAEATYGENRETVSGDPSGTWSVTMRVVTAFWALQPLFGVDHWSDMVETPSSRAAYPL